MTKKNLLTKSWILVSIVAILLFATVGLPLLLFGQGNFMNRGGGRGNVGGVGGPLPVTPIAVTEDTRLRQDGCWAEMSVHIREGDYNVQRVIWIIEPSTQVELIYNWRSKRWEGTICLERGVYTCTFRVYTDDGVMWRIPRDSHWKFDVR